MTEIRTSPDAVVDALASRSYLADRSLATVLYLALELGKPLLLEGEAGVGKTELAKVTADALGARLIRLQCYEGIDVAHALYDWAYAKQMLYIRTLEATGHAARHRRAARPVRPAVPRAPAAARRDRQRRSACRRCC